MKRIEICMQNLLDFFPTKLNKKQLDDVFECLNRLEDGNECIRTLCEKSLKTISTKLNDQQLNRVSVLSFIESLGVIPEKLNEKQLENAINTLIDGLKDKDKDVRKSCVESLGVIATNLTDKQLERVLNALPKEQGDNYFDSYEKTLKEISTKWNEKQSERVFNALIFISKHSINTNNDEDKDRSLVELLGLISTKLNDKQLYLL
ncbi:hypothetical protein RFI_28546, partial [Reticulomyxa filosa]